MIKSLAIVYLIVVLIRQFFRRFIYAYHGYMFESKGKASVLTKIWAVC